MKKFKRKWKGSLKRAAAIALAVLMVSNSIDMSAFAVSAAEEIEEIPCTHEYDETRGEEGAECPVCNTEGTGVNVCMGTTEFILECTCETDDPAIHATNCPAYAAPENPECYCAEKCTEDNINVWCDVCGVQGIEVCKGEDTAAAYAAPKTLYVLGTNALTTNSGNGWSYADGVLTLTNANLTAGTGTDQTVACPIYFQGDLTINIPQGTTSNITCGTDGLGTIYAQTATAGDILTITGGGTLNITNNKTGNYTEVSAIAVPAIRQDVKIDGVTVNLKSSAGSAIDARSISITNGAVVSASASGSSGLYGYRGITIDGGSKVYVCGSSSYAALNAYYGYSVTVSGEDTVLYAGYTLDENGLPTTTIGSKYAVDKEDEIKFNIDSGTAYLAGTSGIAYNDSKITQTGGLLSQQKSSSTSPKTITVSGNHTLTENLTIASNDTLTINEGATLTIPAGKTLKNNGTITNNGTVTNNGTFTNNSLGTCSDTATHCYGTGNTCIICGAANLPTPDTIIYVGGYTVGDTTMPLSTNTKYVVAADGTVSVGDESTTNNYFMLTGDETNGYTLTVTGEVTITQVYTTGTGAYAFSTGIRYEGTAPLTIAGAS